MGLVRDGVFGGSWRRSIPSLSGTVLGITVCPFFATSKTKYHFVRGDAIGSPRFGWA